MKRFLALFTAVLLVLSMFASAVFTVGAEAPVAACSVSVNEYNIGEANYYVAADVTFTSNTEFTAGLFKVEANDLTLTDCTVADCVGGDAPEVQFEATSNKVIFTGFSNSTVNDFKSYTSLTLNLKFSLNSGATSTERKVSVKNIVIANIDEVKFVTDDASGTASTQHTHTLGDQWEFDGYNHWKVCSTCFEKVDNAAHTFDNGVVTARNCTEGGYTTYTCTVCNYSYKANETAPGGHTVGEWLYDTAEHWHVCTGCSVILDKAAHTLGEPVKENEKPATCTEDGSYDSVVYCTVCKAEMSRNTVTVEKTDHSPAEAVKENEVAATYTADGSYDEVVYCSVCKAEISRNTVKVPMKVGTFKITYTLNGGKNNSANPASFKSNAAVTLKNPTRTGYKFEGWYKDSAFKSKITTISKGTAKNVTVYAKWSAVTYKLTYKLNGGKNGKNPASFKVTTATITLKNPTRAGYKFGGWYTDSKFKNKITKITKGTAKNITVYAKWSVVTYKLTYKLNGGKNGKNPKSYKVTTKTFTLKAATRKGYTFKGWYSDSKFKKKVTKVAKGSTGNKTLYAKWAKKK